MATYANMGSHTMKTTIEISDDLFARTQEVARKEKTTLRSLTERGLRLVLEEKLTRSSRNRQWLQIWPRCEEETTAERRRASHVRDEHTHAPLPRRIVWLFGSKARKVTPNRGRRENVMFSAGRLFALMSRLSIIGSP